jgi:chromosome partitioning protein
MGASFTPLRVVPVKTVSICNPKGGTSKSLTTTLLSVKGSQEQRPNGGGKNRVAMIDLNSDQGNLTQWYLRRGEPDNPKLLDDYEDLIKYVRALRDGGAFDHLFIDTPPMVDDSDVVEAAVMLADAVVIPVKSSIFDVESLEPLLEMCRQRRKPFGFLMSDVDERFKSLNVEMLAELTKEAKDGGSVLATRISHRLPYINALTTGQTAPELAAADTTIITAVDGLWHEVEGLLMRPRPALREAAHHDR